MGDPETKGYPNRVKLLKWMMIRKTVVFQPSVLKQQALHQTLFLASNMPNKDELRQQVRALGEEPPQEWKKPQLQARIQELKETMKNTPGTQLKEYLKEMNKAAKKKIHLAESSPTSSNWRSPATRLYLVSSPWVRKPSIAVWNQRGRISWGFGKYSSLSYADTFNYNPQ